MNKAPKKIWLSNYANWPVYRHQHEGQIPYIRADLVDELVGALEAALSHDQPYIERSKTALAKIKDER